MQEQFGLTGKERQRFVAPVEISWIGEKGEHCCALGESANVSLYGLGLILPVDIPIDTKVTVQVDSQEICGGAEVRYCFPEGLDYRIGLHFSLALLRQGVPKLDTMLMKSLRSENLRLPPEESVGLSLKSSIARRCKQFLFLARATKLIKSLGICLYSAAAQAESHLSLEP